MKRSYKLCFGLLLASSIMFGLLFVVSSDTSALKHSITEMPFGKYFAINVRGQSVEMQSFAIGWKEQYNPTYDTSKFNFPKVMSLSYDSDTGKCKFGRNNYNATGNTFSFYPSSAVSIYAYIGNYLYPSDNNFNNPSVSRCARFYEFGTSSSQLPSSTIFPTMNWAVPEFDYSSFPTTYPGLAYMDYYNLVHDLADDNTWYTFSSAAFNDKYIDTTSGMHYSSSLKFSDLLGFKPDKFSWLQIPLNDVISGEFPSDFGALSYGRSITFKGVFDFGNQSVSWHPDAITSGSFKLYAHGFYSDSQGLSSSASLNVDCTANNYLITDIVNNTFSQLEYTCPLVLDRDYDYLQFSIGISSGDGDYIWDLGGSEFSFAGQWMITDNDETPGSSASRSCSGSACETRPGSAYLDYLNEDAEENWFESLIHMFVFGATNPFSGLYQMFGDGTQCVSIPIIGGMLGADSNNQTYCSWFSSDTRSILTPVLSMAAIMLVFGFFIRWLNSSSGNFFEDAEEGEK